MCLLGRLIMEGFGIVLLWGPGMVGRSRFIGRRSRCDDVATVWPKG